MKTKYTNTLVIAISLFMSIASYGQLKVDQYGRIGMGTNYPNSGFKCHIKGNLLLPNYPSSPSYGLEMMVGYEWPGVGIGSSESSIAFWIPSSNFNILYASQFYRVSDSTLKTNIQPITNGLDDLLKLNVYSYTLIENVTNEKTMYGKRGEVASKKEYGLLSQEVERVFPDIDITEDVKGVKLMDYDQLIPILISGMQEQQKMISSLEEQISH